MSLLSNLNYAEQAVKYAEQHLRGRASNKPEDIVHTLQQNLRHISDGDDDYVMDSLRSSLNVTLKYQEVYQARFGDISSNRQARHDAGEQLSSAAIIRDGVGNCFEHAVLACHYLNTKGVRSYIATADQETNHVFVVIGAAGGLDGRKITVRPDATPGPPLGTGTTVVCDPWYHEWFAIQQHWARKMHRILATTNKRSGGLPATVPLDLMASTHVT